MATLEIPLLRGRGFTAQDDQRAPQVAIVNQTFAQKFFPNAEALGQRVTFRRSKREVEIIGVVADTKYTRQREDLKPLLYTPWQQEGEVIGDMYFALRTTGEPTALATTVGQVVRELDSNLPVTESTHKKRARRPRWDRNACTQGCMVSSAGWHYCWQPSDCPAYWLTRLLNARTRSAFAWQLARRRRTLCGWWSGKA